MEIKSISKNQSFGKLYTSGISKQLKTEDLKKEFKDIKDFIRNNNLHKKENVDIILGYNPEDKFYGVISSKEQGIPYNPSSKCNVSATKKSLNRFTSWVEMWEEAYSKSFLKKINEILHKV